MSATEEVATEPEFARLALPADAARLTRLVGRLAIAITSPIAEPEELHAVTVELLARAAYIEEWAAALAPDDGRSA